MEHKKILIVDDSRTALLMESMILKSGPYDDGAAGLLAMKQAGASTLAQDEASCVVFGMPKEAITRRAVDWVVPLAGLPAAILACIARPEPSGRLAPTKVSP